jgi:hypothetical protein
MPALLELVRLRVGTDESRRALFGSLTEGAPRIYAAV